MMNRKEILECLVPFKFQKDIELAIQILNESVSENLTNDEIGKVWELVSKSLDHKFSDDENHPIWRLELDLSKAYKRD